LPLLDGLDRWLKRYERLGAIITTTLLLLGAVGAAVAAVIFLENTKVPAWVPVAVGLAGMLTIVGLAVRRRSAPVGDAMSLREHALEQGLAATEYEKRLLWDALKSLQQAIASEEWWEPDELAERGVLGPARGLLVRDRHEDVRLAVLVPDDDPSTRFRMRWAEGHRSESVRNYSREIDKTMAGLAFRRGDFVESKGVRQDERFQANPKETRPFRSLVAVPLRIGDGIIGVLSVVSTKASAFSESDIAFIKLLGALLDVILTIEFDEDRQRAELGEAKEEAE
jgi:GAF domain-containing protein